jgi:hypothetical protein
LLLELHRLLLIHLRLEHLLSLHLGVGGIIEGILLGATLKHLEYLFFASAFQTPLAVVLGAK